MIDFSQVTGLTIPEGVVTEITDSSGNVLWSANKPVILTVQKITSKTYASATTYENEEFILLDIYPKTNGTVTITYGGLTKTITDTSGAEKPNAQQVFFGTFNGVSDSEETPTSGTLTISGSYSQVAKSVFYIGKSSEGDSNEKYCDCITAIVDTGCMESISAGFAQLSSLTSVVISNSVTSIGEGVFYACDNLTSILFENPSGWSATDGDTTIEPDLTDPTNNVALFVSYDYFDYKWSRI